MARTEKGDALKRGHPVYTNIIYRRRDDPSFGATLLTSASCPASEADLGDWPKLNRHTMASCPVPDPIVSEYKGESAGTENFRGGSFRQPIRHTLASCPVPDPIVSETARSRTEMITGIATSVSFCGEDVCPCPQKMFWPGLMDSPFSCVGTGFLRRQALDHRR